MATHQDTYYVPAQSRLPIFASLSLFLIVYGAATFINHLTHTPDQPGRAHLVLLAGFMLLAVVLTLWFTTVIRENQQGLCNPQMDRSYVWGMSWFIFSEVMFFLAFFGALFYVRMFSGPWLGGEGEKGLANQFLWQGFQFEWPLMATPDQAVRGEGATMRGPEQNMAAPGLSLALLGWIPFWNTACLLSSSLTVHIAHTALKNGNRRGLTLWLAITVLLGLAFIVLQVVEYGEAYRHMGLTLDAGIYGTTFFMLTGFHGFHVCLGAFMLLIMWLRVMRGHFSPEDQFGFEAASWYWHFVDVVWVGLVLFVYVL